MSAIILSARFASLDPRAFRQGFCRQKQASLVARGIGEHAEAIKHAHSLQDGGVDANADTRVAGFDTSERRARCECATGDYISGQAAAESRLAQIRSQFGECAANRYGR
jgi:hypothetical protein